MSATENDIALQNENIVNLCVLYYCSSYLHCKWATLKELEKDPRIHQKIKRFRTKQAQMKHLFTEVTRPVAAVKSVSRSRFLRCFVCDAWMIAAMHLRAQSSFLRRWMIGLMLINFTWYFQPDEDLFNPDYVEVDRVLDVAVTTDTETGEVGIKNPLAGQPGNRSDWSSSLWWSTDVAYIFFFFLL